MLDFSGRLTWSRSPCRKSAGTFNLTMTLISLTQSYIKRHYIVHRQHLWSILSLSMRNCTQQSVYSFSRLPVPSFIDTAQSPKINAPHGLPDRFAVSSHFCSPRLAFVAAVITSWISLSLLIRYCMNTLFNADPALFLHINYRIFFSIRLYFEKHLTATMLRFTVKGMVVAYKMTQEVCFSTNRTVNCWST